MGSCLMFIWLLLQLPYKQLEAIKLGKGDLLISHGGHWNYFISDNQIFHVVGTAYGAEPIFNTLNAKEKEQLAVCRMWFFRKYRTPETRRKDGEDIPKLGDVGLKLAKRLKHHSMNFHFHIFRCNCKHYVDYVIYGTTFGSWSDPTYLPLNKKCPLHKRVTPFTNVDADDFVLRDGNNVEIKLTRPPWPILPDE